jgi:peroxiredoxin family protein
MNMPETSLASPFDQETFNRWFDERLEQQLAAREAAHTPSLAIIVTKGTLDMAYPPFILASTASALGWDVSVFFTFYGLELLKKNLTLEISPLGNPAMPMKMPIGSESFRAINWKIPNLIAGNVPGFESFATNMMKKTMQNKGVASIEELREACVEGGVKFVACQMTVDVFGYTPADFIPEVQDWIGAASCLPIAQQADVSLFI